MKDCSPFGRPSAGPSTMTARFRAALLAAPLLLAAAVSAQPTSTRWALGAEVDRVLTARAFDDAYWGAYIVDLDTGDVLYDRNGSRRFIPASNMKILTTAAALDALGPDWRYYPRLYAEGEIRNGTLDGALVVRGAGDPTFGGRYTAGDLTQTFRQWADSLQALGVRRVRGPIIGDDNLNLSGGGHIVFGLKVEWRAEQGQIIMDLSPAVIACEPPAHSRPCSGPRNYRASAF